MQSFVQQRSIDHEAGVIKPGAQLRHDDVDVVHVRQVVAVAVDGEVHEGGERGLRVVPEVLGALVVGPLERLREERAPGGELAVELLDYAEWSVGVAFAGAVVGHWGRC